ncbi:putative periplasmic binding protein [groundwater metagenome]|uniref:Putative periplasmic binding protein n=1 Tax=groundwater metagenome TaxID=717931 RepID=A0A098E886_9ZZZZ
MKKINKNKVKGKLDVLFIGAVIAAIIGIVVFSGCIGEPQKEQKSAIAKKETKTYTDDLNRTVEIPKNPERIVVIATADIEILFAINASDKIIGRPNFQKYPLEALKIDDIGGMYPLNLEKIMDKNPDLILITMTFQEKYIKQVEQLGSYNLTVLAFNYPNTIDDIINHITDIGEVVGKENEANDLTENITFRINKITMLTNELNESQKPGVYREWIYESNKGSTVGRTARDNELIIMAGGKNIFGDVKKSSFEANFEEVIIKNPKVIIITANLDKFKLDELKDVIKSRPGWENIDAVKNNRICIVEDQITWANPRLIRGLEEFTKCIHPELFENEK